MNDSEMCCSVIVVLAVFFILILICSVFTFSVPSMMAGKISNSDMRIDQINGFEPYDDEYNTNEIFLQEKNNGLNRTIAINRVYKEGNSYQSINGDAIYSEEELRSIKNISAKDSLGSFLVQQVDYFEDEFGFKEKYVFTKFKKDNLTVIIKINHPLETELTDELITEDIEICKKVRESLQFRT